jgi:hypothetical protein
LAPYKTWISHPDQAQLRAEYADHTYARYSRCKGAIKRATEDVIDNPHVSEFAIETLCKRKVEDEREGDHICELHEWIQAELSSPHYKPQAAFTGIPPEVWVIWAVLRDETCTLERYLKTELAQKATLKEGMMAAEEFQVRENERVTDSNEVRLTHRMNDG